MFLMTINVDHLALIAIKISFSGNYGNLLTSMVMKMELVVKSKKKENECMKIQKVKKCTQLCCCLRESRTS